MARPLAALALDSARLLVIYESTEKTPSVLRLVRGASRTPSHYSQHSGSQVLPALPLAPMLALVLGGPGCSRAATASAARRG